MEDRFEKSVVNVEERSAGNHRRTARRANIRQGEAGRKRIDRRRNESPKRASIPVEGRMTFGKLRASRGGRFPWVKSTYRLRSRRSSEFPVINYGVDDRVPLLFLLLLPPSPAVLFLLILLLLLRPPFPINVGSSPFSPPARDSRSFLPLFSLFT